jgi:hypothetical protein
MIGTTTEGSYSNDLDPSDSANWKPDYPIPREPVEKRVAKLMSNQNAPITSLINTRFALTILGLMLLLSGMIVVGAVFLASIGVKPLQTTITRFLYKQPDF